MVLLNVNNSGTIQLTSNLEKLNRSAFPSAVRNTLNNAAFNMKTKGLLISANENFANVRNPIFFKRFTEVNKAKGFDVNKMAAIVGFSNASDPKVRNVIEGLYKHEYGGIVNNGSRYLKSSRNSGSYKKKVRKTNYYDKNKVITGRSSGKGTRKSKFVARMWKSDKENKAFFMNSIRGNFLVKTTSISRTSNGGIKSRLKFLMMSRKKTPVKIKRNQFVSEAALMESKMMDSYFKANAEYQFLKELKRK
jgi:hypothetical protein